ncbi:MAG: radical SAM protein, partial [Desulfonatronovibrio sp.]
PTSYLGARERVYPLGLARLAGLVEEKGQISALDMNLYADPWPVLKDQLLSFEPDLAVLSFRNLDPLAGHQTSYLSALKTTATLVHSLLPQTRILSGGPAFSLFAERLMQEIPQIDAGIIGEGELAFARLLKSFPDFEGLPGTVMRKPDSLQQTVRPRFIDLDELPRLDDLTFAPANYLQGNAYVAALGIEGKRGCDLSCAYCVYPCLGGGRMRLRDPQKIVDEMQFLSQEHAVNLFHFTDPVLNRPADHFEAICRELKRRKLDIQWTGFFREDTLSKEQLLLARDAGLIAVYFSADALTEHGLKVLNKKMDKQNVLNASRLTAECGMLTMCHFLCNLPGETPALIQEAWQTLDQILEIHATAGNLGAVIFNTVRLYPEAPLTRKLLREGLLDPEVDLLYPVYYNPPSHAHILHELETHCHAAGVFSRLNLH